MIKTIILCTTLLGMNEALLPECIEYEAEKNDTYLQRQVNIKQITMEELYEKGNSDTITNVNLHNG